MAYKIKKAIKLDKHHKIVYSPINQAYLVVRSDGKVLAIKNTLKEAKNWNY